MRVLTVNTGSSSLKAALWNAEAGGAETLVASREWSGLSSGESFEAALGEAYGQFPAPGAIGHRLVVGGDDWNQPRPLDAAALAALRALLPLAPDHLPQAVRAIEMAQTRFPEAGEVGCSDSAFHRTLPAVARTFALPRRLTQAGVVRRGYHGLSCEYILSELRRWDPGAAAGKLVIAHLGNGASLTAVRDGSSIETTMGFTPLGGLPMATRPGDLDPGVLLYLMQVRQLDGPGMNELLNHESGLRGISGSSGDMRQLLAAEGSDAAAALAVEIFVYQTRKYLGALAAVLGGIDTLVFTGGIGENAATIRTRILDGLEWMVSSARVMHTDEDRMIARHTAALLQGVS